MSFKEGELQGYTRGLILTSQEGKITIFEFKKEEKKKPVNPNGIAKPKNKMIAKAWDARD